MSFFQELAQAFQKTFANDLVKAALPLILSGIIVIIKSVRRWIFGDEQQIAPPWRAGMVAGIISSAALYLFATILQDYSKVPSLIEKPSIVVDLTSKRQIGAVYQNTSDRLKIITITAFREDSGTTIFASISTSAEHLPAGTIGGSNTTTVAAVSFPNRFFQISFTFSVPKNYYYVISGDGAGAKLYKWIETDI